MKKQNKFNLLSCLIIPFKTATVPALFMTVFQIVVALIPLARTLLLADFIDAALTLADGREANLWFPLGGIVVLFGFNRLLENISHILNTWITACLSKNYRLLLLKKRAALKYCCVENPELLDLAVRITQDAEKEVLGGFHSAFQLFLVIPLKTVSVFILLLQHAPLVVVAVAILIVPLTILSVKTGYKRHQDRQKLFHLFRRSFNYQNELTCREGVEERAVFGTYGPFSTLWRKTFRNAWQFDTMRDLKDLSKRKAVGSISLVINLITAIILLPSLAEGSLTVGLFIGLLTAAGTLVDPLFQTLPDQMYLNSIRKRFINDMNRFLSLDEEPGALDLPVPVQLKAVPGVIFFRNVSFHYPGTDRYILKNCSFEIQPGLHYALVGANGCGKTTLVKLLTGLYRDYEGDIYIGEKNLRDYSQAELKGFFSVVFQDFAKYEIPFCDNIALGDINNTNPGTSDAIENAGLQDVLHRLGRMDVPLGKLTSDSYDLSGGEWQRVAIARALVSPAPLCILDEPTASLDPIAESDVYKNFDKLSYGRTTIFITHRLGAAKLADVIIVLKDGHVAEYGTHNELIALNGLYAEMFQAQSSWYIQNTHTKGVTNDGTE